MDTSLTNELWLMYVIANADSMRLSELANKFGVQFNIDETIDNKRTILINEISSSPSIEDNLSGFNSSEFVEFSQYIEKLRMMKVGELINHFGEIAPEDSLYITYKNISLNKLESSKNTLIRNIIRSKYKF